MKKFIVFLAVLFLFLHAKSLDFTYNGLTYTIVDSNAKTVETKHGNRIPMADTAGNPVSGEVVIPEKVYYSGEEYTVIGLAYMSFINRPSITSVTLPPTIQYIGEYAIHNTGISEMTFPNSVKKIEVGAIFACKNLKSVKFGNNIEILGSGICKECDNLSEVDLGSIPYLPEEMFYKCYSLQSVVIPETVHSIGKNAFYQCNSLQEITLLSNTPPELQSNSFNNYSATLIVPYGTANEYSNTLWGNFYNIEEADGDGVVSDGVFSYKYNSGTEEAIVVYNKNYLNVTSASIPDRVYIEDIENPSFFTVTGISSRAFNGCSKLEQVKLPSQCKEIGENAFYGCSSIKNIILPSSVTMIGNNAFYGCSNLESITVLAENPPVIQESTFSNYNSKLIIPEGTWLTYLSTFWRKFNYMEDMEGFPIADYNDGVFVYKYYAWAKEAILIQNEKYVTMTSVSIPDRVYIEDEKNPDFYQVIGIYENAFKDCTELSLLKLPSKCQFIGQGAFQGCSSLKGSLTIPETVTQIDASAFRECTGLEKVVLPPNLESISNGLFYDCTELREVTIPKNVTTIGDWAFARLRNLTNIEIPYGVIHIGENAFALCTSLESITIPASVNYIGVKAFYNCWALQDFIFEDGLSPIFVGESLLDAQHEYNVELKNVYLGRSIEGDMCFGDTGTSLKRVEVGYLVTKIPANLFKGCGGLETLIINPSSQLIIGESAFEGCSSLSEIYIPETVIEIGNRAFFGINVKEIIIPNASIGDYSFAGNVELETITIGSKVKNIGEYAFDGANRIQQINSTPLTPPIAFNSTFSYYEAPLYVPEVSFDSYYNSHQCWYRFSTFKIIEAEEIEMNYPQNVPAEDGAQFQLEANILPSDVTLPQVLWHSTNPEVASVDNNGLVTLHIQNAEVSTSKKAKQYVECEIIASTLYDDGPLASVKINGTTDSTLGIYEIREDINFDFQTGVMKSNHIFNSQGILIKENASVDDLNHLSPGIYLYNGKKLVVK